jgi:hypothetical protein
MFCRKHRKRQCIGCINGIFYTCISASFTSASAYLQQSDVLAMMTKSVLVLVKQPCSVLVLLLLLLLVLLGTCYTTLYVDVAVVNRLPKACLVRSEAAAFNSCGQLLH